MPYRLDRPRDQLSENCFNASSCLSSKVINEEEENKKSEIKVDIFKGEKCGCTDLRKNNF